MYALFPMRSTCYVLCRLNSNTRMYFALKLHEVSPCPYPCLEGLVLVLILVGRVFVLVLGGSVLVNITGSHTLYGNIFTRCGCSFTSCPGHCMTVHSLHVANCHDKIWWTMSDYFPVYFFWATVCASTRDNRYNCALPTTRPKYDMITRWGEHE